jgi:hypothetical protein
MHGFALRWTTTAEAFDIVLSAMNVDCIASELGSLSYCMELARVSRELLLCRIESIYSESSMAKPGLSWKWQR